MKCFILVSIKCISFVCSRLKLFPDFQNLVDANFRSCGKQRQKNDLNENSLNSAWSVWYSWFNCPPSRQRFMVNRFFNIGCENKEIYWVSLSASLTASILSDGSLLNQKLFKQFDKNSINLIYELLVETHQIKDKITSKISWLLDFKPNSRRLIQSQKFNKQR